MNKKAQGATEYLIIFAVIIVVALIVVAAMGGIPGIGTGTKQKTSASYWQTADVAIPAFAAFSLTDDVNITVRNNLRDSISSFTISVNGVGLSCAQASISPGQQITCWNQTAASDCSAGGPFTYDVSITYTNDETKGTYTYTGDGHKLEGTCAN
jgi:hypothetical protein